MGWHMHQHAMAGMIRETCANEVATVRPPARALAPFLSAAAPSRDLNAPAPFSSVHYCSQLYKPLGTRRSRYFTGFQSNSQPFLIYESPHRHQLAIVFLCLFRGYLYHPLSEVTSRCCHVRPLTSPFLPASFPSNPKKNRFKNFR